MFEKIIEFTAHEDYYNLGEDFPEPIKLNVPEWYKKLKHNLKDMTIKGCMPFLDSITSGYVLKLPQDMWVHHHFDKHDEKGNFLWKDSIRRYALQAFNDINVAKGINLNPQSDSHPVSQLGGKDGGCPLLKKNGDLPVYKILNPWKIKTPPGYSCLFTAPLNNRDDRFEIISGIVDTDTFDAEINFPFIINTDKYPELETLFKKGTPYVQVIPFKRDRWKATFKKATAKQIWSERITYHRKLFNIYKQGYWQKKSWK